MNREIHVRFWEGLGVRFPRATHSGNGAIFGRQMALATLGGYLSSSSKKGKGLGTALTRGTRACLLPCQTLYMSVFQEAGPLDVRDGRH